MSDPVKRDHERPVESHGAKSSQDPSVRHRFLTAVSIGAMVGLGIGVLTSPFDSAVWEDYLRAPVVGVVAVVVLRAMGKWPFKM